MRIKNDATIDHNIDGIISKINSFEGTKRSADKIELLADLYTEKGDYTTAEALLSQLEVNPEKQNLVKLKRVNNNFKQNNQSLYALQSDAVSKQKVEDVAADNSNQGTELAINMLQQVFNEAYQEPIDELNHSSHHYVATENNTVITDEPKIVCYPNPAKENISFFYNLEDDFRSGTIEIYNTLGQKIKSIGVDASSMTSTINIAEIPNGLYFYSLVINDVTIANYKFVISK